MKTLFIFDPTNNHTMKNVTAAALSEIVKNVTRSTIVSITYHVDESKSRTVKGKKQLQKTVSLTAYLNHDYQNKVIKLTGNTEFVADPMKGKTKLSNTVLENANGERMLYATVLKSNPKKTTYFHNGEEITKADAIVKELFSPSYFTEQTTKGRGEVDEEDDFSLISPKFTNIKELKLNGETYMVEG
jgi:hypothetical protein